MSGASVHGQSPSEIRIYTLTIRYVTDLYMYQMPTLHGMNCLQIARKSDSIEPHPKPGYLQIKFSASIAMLKPRKCCDCEVKQ